MRPPRIPLWWLMIAAPYCGIVLAVAWGNLWQLIGTAASIMVGMLPSLIVLLWARSHGRPGLGIHCCIGFVTGFWTCGAIAVLDVAAAYLRHDIHRVGDIGLIGGPLNTVAILAVIGAVVGTLVGLIVGLWGSLIGWPMTTGDDKSA